MGVSFEDFVREVYPFVEMTSFHHTYYRLLEAFARGRVRKLIVTMPPPAGGHCLLFGLFGFAL